AQRRATAGAAGVVDEAARFVAAPGRSEPLRLRASGIAAPAGAGHNQDMSRISIASPQEEVAVDRAAVRQVVRTVLDGEAVADYEISLAFVDNATIHQLNK